MELVDFMFFRNAPYTARIRNFNHLASYLRHHLQILLNIRGILSRGDISVMHLNSFISFKSAFRCWVAMLLAKRVNVPCIVHLHGTFFTPSGNSLSAHLLRWAYRALFKGAARILALGKPSYKAILDLGDFGAKTRRLIPNFIDFSNVPAARPDEKGEFLRVIFTGSLIEAKGIYALVAIAKRLPKIRLQIVGGGPPALRAELARRIREAGVADRVQVSGPFPNREILELLAQNDVFLFPTQFKFEGFPASVTEAMAVGLPVVASSLGALPEMIDVPAGGFLFAPDDIDSYVQALQRLHADPELRREQGCHNREKARREYDFKVVVQDLCDIYQAAIQSSPGQ